ncbi:MAG TPA: lipid-binding SYLF domain-containing protein [Vicinamibacterales bacterium]|jgi:lipid-binding SYLF domain-containing protein|nr:lipid-binding SYLF domain-containing protein [Vicinamibacterales bacterium]
MAVVAGMVVAAGSALRADDERLQTAATVLTEMTSAPDNDIPASLMQKAKCVVVIPGVKKAALGVGGQYGRGYIACRRDVSGGWSAPGAIRIEGGSIGFQIGGSDTDVILLVLNDRGADRLLSSRFTVGADAAVAAGPVGRQASAETDATMMAEILAWSRSRGVFAGISLKGSTLREDASENKDLYGREISNKDIVNGTATAPPSAAPLMAVLAKL